MGEQIVQTNLEQGSLTPRRPSLDSQIGRRMRLRRRALGLTQTDVAERIGVRFQQVQKYETGVNRISAVRLFRVCRALDIEPAYFLDGLVEPVGDRDIVRLRSAQS